MLIIDDVLLSPLTGLSWVVSKIQAAAVEELAAERERITSDLSELYMLLDTGKISEEEFDRRESELLNRLDEIDAIEGL